MKEPGLLPRLLALSSVVIVAGEDYMHQSTLFPGGNQPRCIIVTGDRHAIHDEWLSTISHTLAKFHTPGSILIHGGQGYRDDEGTVFGIDTIASLWADGYSVIRMPAQWDAYGKSAGPRRNRAMIDLAKILQAHGYEVRVIAFHNTIEQSKGTKDMVNASRRAGFPVTVYGNDGKVLS